MADCWAILNAKNIDAEEFESWLEEETSGPDCGPVEGWDLGASYEGGYGGYFYEALALKMIITFKGIVFECVNSVAFDDHCVKTSCECNGKEVSLARSLELPDEDDEYMRAQFEVEYDIPYLAKFTVKEVMSCSEIYDVVGENIKDSALVEATCAEHKISKERFMEFANIFDFRKRWY